MKDGFKFGSAVRLHVGFEFENGNRHRASASEVSKVKNGRSDASVHGFVIWLCAQTEVRKAFGIPYVEVCSWDLRTIVQHENQYASQVVLGLAFPEL